MSAVLALPDRGKHLFMHQVVTWETEPINILFVKDAKTFYEI